MICHDVKRVVYFYLDGTMTETRSSELCIHIEHCSECQARTNFHRRLRHFIQKRLQRVEAPDHLKTRLTRTIRAVTFEL